MYVCELTALTISVWLVFGANLFWQQTEQQTATATTMKNIKEEKIDRSDLLELFIAINKY